MRSQKVGLEISKKKALWTRIGVPSSHNDSEGFTITLHVVPVDGLLVVRKFPPLMVRYRAVVSEIVVPPRS